MNKKFLLYIDILGFADLVAKGHVKLEWIYHAIDNLHVHNHGQFEVIVFSDTILVYNKFQTKTVADKTYTIMYLCEFAQDLLYRLADTGVCFRAVIQHGDFKDSKMKNIRAFYGPSLVSAYYIEKKLPSIGLFIDGKCNQYNEIFSTVKFVDNLHFVVLTKNLDRLKHYGMPFDRAYLEDYFDLPYLVNEIAHLKFVNKVIKSTAAPSEVRSKYLHAWNMYEKHFGKMIIELRQNNFDFELISAGFNWKKYLTRFRQDKKYYREG